MCLCKIEHKISFCNKKKQFKVKLDGEVQNQMFHIEVTAPFWLPLFLLGLWLNFTEEWPSSALHGFGDPGSGGLSATRTEPKARQPICIQFSGFVMLWYALFIYVWCFWWFFFIHLVKLPLLFVLFSKCLWCRETATKEAHSGETQETPETGGLEGCHAGGTLAPHHTFWHDRETGFSHAPARRMRRSWTKWRSLRKFNRSSGSNWSWPPRKPDFPALFWIEIGWLGLSWKVWQYITCILYYIILYYIILYYIILYYIILYYILYYIILYYSIVYYIILYYIIFLYVFYIH